MPRYATSTLRAMPTRSPCANKKFGELSQASKFTFSKPADIDMPWQHAAEMPGTDLAAALGTAMAPVLGFRREAGPEPD